MQTAPIAPAVIEPYARSFWTYDQPRGAAIIWPPPVATALSLSPLPSPSWLICHHFFASLITVSRGSTIPASWHARSPSAAYCEFELSPVGGPSFCFWTATLLTTLGLALSALISLAALATTGRL